MLKLLTRALIVKQKKHWRHIQGHLDSTWS